MVATKKTAVKPKAKPVAKVATKPAAKAPVKKPTTKPAAKVAVKPAAKVAAKPAAKKSSKKAPVITADTANLAAKLVAKQAAAKAATAKAASTVKLTVNQPAPAPTPVMAKPVAAPVVKASGPAKKPSFKVGELVVYPAHGVGKITNIEEQEIAGVKLELYIVDFEKEKLRLKVPTNRAEQKGMRHLADRSMIEQAMKVIRGRARIKRTMWSRRAQEYDAKINSGDMIAVAEVIRDLYRSERQPEQSYSERQLFEQALARFARELAAVRKIDDDQCIKELEDFLARNAKRAANDKADDSAAEEAA
jgi:CarD family transcriptional regulator